MEIFKLTLILFSVENLLHSFPKCISSCYGRYGGGVNDGVLQGEVWYFLLLL